MDKSTVGLQGPASELVGWIDGPHREVVCGCWESSIITVAKHPWYVVNGSRESCVHVCQLLNEARQFVEGRDKKKKRKQGNSEEACPLSCSNKPVGIPVGENVPDVSCLSRSLAKSYHASNVFSP